MKKLMTLGLVVFLVGALAPAVKADTLIFSDDFSSGFGSQWTTGTNSALNSTVEVRAQNGSVEWYQRYDYIETVQSFDTAFRVEVDLERTQGSVQCKDFAVELVGTENLCGVLRLQYGTITKDTINLGQEPATNSRSANYQGVCVDDVTGYKMEMETVSPHKGTASLTYQDGQVKFAFTNYGGMTIETPWKQAGTLGPRKIRIWATSEYRYVDAVRVYSLSAQPDKSCSYVDMSNFDVVMPCLIFDGVRYRLRLVHDPTIPNGLYWKLDESSIEPAE